MRRDTQIGVILGVVILGIIAVFLSTRSNVDKQTRKELDEYGRSERGQEQQQLVSPIEEFEDDTVVEGTLESDVEDIKEMPTFTGEEGKSGGKAAEKAEESGEMPEVKVVEEVEGIAEEKEVGKEVETVAVKAETEVAGKVIEKKVEVKKDASSATKERGLEEVGADSATGRKRGIKDLIHKVEANDNLFTLAKKYYGDPKEWLKIYNANVDVIYDRNSLPIGKELIIPAVEIFDAEPSKEHISLPLPTRSGGSKTHIVQRGDTLYKLSRLYYGSTEDWILIYNANKGQIGSNNALYIGQELIIPETRTLAKTAAERSDSSPLRSQQVVTEPKERDFRTYEVKKGDTLFKIAKQFYNDETKWRKIYEANKEIIPNSNSIQQGKVIIIPE